MYFIFRSMFIFKYGTETALGNRGMCAQPCRLPYELYEKDNQTPLNKGFLLSPKDLNGTAFLPELIKIGVHSFKIEGRLKNPEYVAEVTRYYRKYIDLIYNNIDLEIDEIKKIIKKELNITHEDTSMNDKEEIAQVFNRGGFSNGHLPNTENKNLIYKEKSNNIGIYIGNVQKINTNKGHLFIELKNNVSIGDRIGIENNTYTISELMYNGENIKTASLGMIVEIGRMKGNININDKIFKIESKPLSLVLNQTFSCQKEFKKIPIKAKVIIEEDKLISLEISGEKNTIYENSSFRVTSTEKPEKALTAPITVERVKDQISKTGNTQFEFSDIIINLGEGLFIPKISILNDLRRNAIIGLEKMVIRKMTRTINSISITQNNIIKKICTPKINLLLNKISLDKDYLCLENIDKLYIPLNYFIDKKYENIMNSLCNKYITYIYMPNIIRDNKKINFSKIQKKYNLKGAIISNLSQINLFKNIDIIANYSLNIFNEFSTQELKDLNINTFTISPELNKQDVINLIQTTPLQSELIVYGKLPLMTNNYCYLSNSNKCFKDCKKLCQKETTYYLKDRLGYEFTVIPQPIYGLTTIYNSKITSIKYDDININNVRIDILDEDPEQIQNIIDTIKKCERFEGNNYTNGKIKK